MSDAVRRCFREGEWQVDELANLAERLTEDNERLKAENVRLASDYRKTRKALLCYRETVNCFFRDRPEFREADRLGDLAFSGCKSQIK